MSTEASSSLPPLVLVVEDEAVLRFLAADILENSGVRVVEAENAKEALEVLAERSDVRVLFTDINMPGALDGLALARQVHVRWPTIRLVLTSGRVRPSGSEIPDSGRFVAKPYSLDTLVERIQEATDKPDLAAEL